MTNIFHVVYQLILLFLLMAVGYGCRKLGVMGAEASGILANIVINVTLPASIISAVANIGEGLDTGTILIYIAYPV